MPNNRVARCKCGYLEDQANHPDSPISFDPQLNEYHFIHLSRTMGEVEMMIYHCPFCGGRAPKSRRDNLFHRITHAELQRLSELTKCLRTIQDVMGTFGEPDIRQPVGTTITTPERDGKPETTQSYPVMIYTKLSNTADVHVTVYPMDKVAFAFQGKEVRDKVS
jgi:hypothetical protein